MVQAGVLGMLSRICEKDVRRFEEDGATVLRGFFGANWIHKLREAAELNLADPGQRPFSFQFQVMDDVKPF